MTVAAGVHGAVWLLAIRRVEAGLAAWLDGKRQAGWTITSAAPRRSGWPLAATVLLPELAVDGSGAGVPVAGAADMVGVGVSAAHPGTLRVAASGAQRWRLGMGGGLGVTADALSLDTDGTGMVLAARGLAVTGLAGMGPSSAGSSNAGPSSGGPSSAGLDRPGLGGGVRAASLDIEAAGLGFTVHLAGVAGDGLPWPAADAVVQGALTRPIPDAADLPAAAAAWRDAGGRIELRGVSLAAPPLHATASGTAGLDGALQPVLDMKAVVGGYRPALDRLVAAGTVPASAAVAAKAVLGLLSGRDPDAPALVPVRAGDGVVTVAGFALIRLPRVFWRTGDGTMGNGTAGDGAAGRRAP